MRGDDVRPLLVQEAGYAGNDPGAIGAADQQPAGVARGSAGVIARRVLTCLQRPVHRAPCRYFLVVPDDLVLGVVTCSVAFSSPLEFSLPT